VTEEVIEEVIVEDTVVIVEGVDLQEEVQFDAEVLTEEVFRGQDLLQEEGGEAEAIHHLGLVHLQRRGEVSLVPQAGAEADHTADQGHLNQRRPEHYVLSFTVSSEKIWFY